MADIGPGGEGWVAGDRVLVEPINRVKGVSWARPCTAASLSGAACSPAAPPRDSIRGPTPLRTYELQILGSNGWTRADLEALLQMIRASALRPVIDCTLPLEEVHEGLRLLEDREVVGNVVIAP